MARTHTKGWYIQKGNPLCVLPPSPFLLSNRQVYASKSTVDWSDVEGCADGCRRARRQLRHFVDPRGNLHIAWLSLQAVVFLYNAWVVPLRLTFPGK